MLSFAYYHKHRFITKFLIINRFLNIDNMIGYKLIGYNIFSDRWILLQF